jgi:hypothetical protein
VAKEDVFPCIEHVLVHVELVTGGDEELALCGVDLLKVGTTHPCPWLVGVCIAVKGVKGVHEGGKKDALIHDLVRKHKSHHGDKILRAPGRIDTIEEVRVGVAAAWGIAGLLEFSEVVKG